MKFKDMDKMSLQELDDAATAGEKDSELLLEVIQELMDRIKGLEEQLLSVEVEPRKNKDLAFSVVRFAEWQTAGYGGCNETRSVVGQALWSEVAEHVYAITGRYTEDVGADSTQLDAAAAADHTGGTGASALQQSLFVLH